MNYNRWLQTTTDAQEFREGFRLVQGMPSRIRGPLYEIVYALSVAAFERYQLRVSRGRYVE